MDAAKWRPHLLLQFKHLNEAPASLHRVKNDNSIIVHRFIHKFKRPARAVKTDDRVLFRQLANTDIAQPVMIRAQNVLFANPMPKRRIVERNDCVHGEMVA
jgi:hypothetical protein